MKRNAATVQLEEAELDIKQSQRQVENALVQLNDKLEDGVKTLGKWGEIAKRPWSVVGLALTVGIFFGQVIRISFKK